MNLDFITPDLHQLRSQFNQRGFDLRLVGGVVRDTLAGLPPKDVDLCTDADPQQQIEIYRDNGHRWIETGLQHGTVTVVLSGEPHEITSLRVDTDTDGRHAQVEFTKDWEQDLGRRDLTINAMALTFDGQLIDPFGGADDLRNKVVRFVGDADQRIREDYLRILRWFRFHARFGSSVSTTDQDVETLEAIQRNASGLEKISRERVWSEMRRIAVHDRGPAVMHVMALSGVAKHIDLPASNHSKTIMAQAQRWTQNPELLLAAWCGWSWLLVEELAQDWKWSNAERKHVEWLLRHYATKADLRYLIAVENAPREWAAELAALERRDAWEQNALVHWQFDPFPVSGDDLIALGFKPGKNLGHMLGVLKQEWAKSGYTATQDQLLDMVRT